MTEGCLRLRHKLKHVILVGILELGGKLGGCRGVSTENNIWGGHVWRGGVK